MKVEINETLNVYTIVERGNRKLWIRIGSATVNREGSIDVQLDAVPTNGTLHLRAMRPTEGA